MLRLAATRFAETPSQAPRDEDAEVGAGAGVAGMPVRVEPFASSHAAAYALRRAYDLTECAICMSSNRKLFALHGDKRHAICVPCASQLRTLSQPCPFCRAPI
jgi:hypothetical protein